MNCSRSTQRVQRGGVKLWLVFSVVLAVLAGVGYAVLRADFGKLSESATKGSAEPGANSSLKPLSDEQLERMVAQASRQTQQEPKNASAWAMLAHSYEMMGKFSESAKAYAQLVQLLPGDAQVLADYADALAVANGRSFKGEPLTLLQRALALDAKNVKALLLTGIAYVQEQNPAQALPYLEQARSATADPGLLGQIDASIAQAKALTGAAPAAAVAALPAHGASAGDVAVNQESAQVSGRVFLAEDLRAKVPTQATLFLYARPVEGSRMPVALLRKKVSDLPMNFHLDDSMAMVPNTSLSMQAKVVVVARISLRGNVTPQAGDFEGISAPVSVGTKDLKLEISEVLK